MEYKKDGKIKFSEDFLAILKENFTDEQLNVKVINKKTKGIIYIIISITLSIIAVIIASCLGYLLIKSQISMESIISLLLAFFSIFISIFFYFKADESNTKFYNSSYSFMKDVSVILGRIEERFGEKLNNMSEKLNSIEDKRKELNNVEEDKDKIISELMEKTNLNQSEKEQYKRILSAKEDEAEELKKDLYYLEKRNRMFRNELVHNNLLNKNNKELESLFYKYNDDKSLNKKINKNRYTLMLKRRYIVKKYYIESI